MKSLLILFHCGSNTGFAVGRLEATFFRMALELCEGEWSRIHFGYPSMDRGPSGTVPAEFNQYVIVDTGNSEAAHCHRVAEYIRQHHIDVIFGFDQPVHRPLYRCMREAGVTHFISYWGAPMSSINSPVRLLLKRLEVALRRHGPDHYVFESQGMADTAVLGRGVARSRTSVVGLGVDVTEFRPDAADAGHVYEAAGIARSRRIFFYSGHMEPRKGVAVIMRAANRLVLSRREEDWHIYLLGNRPGEEAPYLAMLTARARQHVTFGGYRDDVPLIQRGCYAAVIASDGWDSLTRSAIEMQASGLPVLVSDLAGLREAVEPDESGQRFIVGDDGQLASWMQRLLDDPALRDRLATGARRRAERQLTLERQLSGLVSVVRTVTSGAIRQ